MGAYSRIYSNTVADFMSGKLLDGEQLRRISDAEFFDAVKMLFDYGYGEGLNAEDTTIDELTLRERERLVEFALEYAFDPKLIAYLTDRYLFTNLKAALKSKLFRIPAKYYRGFEAEVRRVTDGEGILENGIAEDAVTAILNASSERDITPAEIDIKLTKAMYKSLLSAARGHRDLTAYVRAEIDFKNIATTYRVKRLAGGVDYFVSQLIDGGVVGHEALIAFLDASGGIIEDLPDEYADIEQAISGENGLVDFERAADEALYRFTEKGSENMNGVAPFIRYFTGKEIEIKTVQMILILVKNDARSEIQRRIRRLYD